MKLNESNTSAASSNPIFFSSQATPSLIRSSGIVTTVLKNPVTAFSRPPQISPFANDSQLALIAPIAPMIIVSGKNSLVPNRANFKMLWPILPNVATIPVNQDVMFVKILAIDDTIDSPTAFLKPCSLTLSIKLPLSFDPLGSGFDAGFTVDGADNAASFNIWSCCSFRSFVKDINAAVR